MQRSKQPAHKHHARKGLWLWSAFGVAGLGLITALIVLVYMTAFSRNNPNSADRATAKTLLRQAVSVETASSLQQTITSKLGFSVSFNSQLIDASAKVITSSTRADVFTDEDALRSNSYAVVDLSVKDSAVAISDSTPTFPPTLAILTNANRDFFERRRAAQPGLSDEQLVVAHYAPQTANKVVPKLTDQTTEKIGDITYQRLTYKLTHEQFPSSAQTQIQYITVQNGRPFALVISYFAATAEGDLAPLLQAIAAMTYTPPAQDAKYLSSTDTQTSVVTNRYANPGIVQAAATLNTPTALASPQDIRTVVENQLAVVRVGTVNCYDITLRLATGEQAMQATDACAAGVGSGSIITPTGTVLTNGHVSILPVSAALMTYIGFSIQSGNMRPLEQYTAFLEGSKIIGSSEAQALRQLVPKRDTAALQAFSASFERIPEASLTATTRSRSYVIQLSNEPMRVDHQGTKIAFTTTKSVVAATFIGANYSGKAALPTTATMTSDVALLQMRATRSFPVIELGSSAGLAPADPLLVIGYPVFIDGGTGTTQRYTVPTATQGKVESSYAFGPYRLIDTSVPAAQGNSGGPALDRNGKQVGVLTYASQKAATAGAGVTSLSKYSILRDIADAKALAQKYAITPTSSGVSDDWHRAVAAFDSADYDTALAYLEATDRAYPGHYLVADVIARAKQANGTATASPKLIVALVLGAALLADVCALLYMLIRRHERQTPLSLHHA